MASVESWSELGFASLQDALDKQSTQINEFKEDGLASRRALTAQTKSFRKLNDEEKLGEVRALLKNYQTEIDKLTNRCKFAESSFMDVYRSLALLPDPSALLTTQQAEISKLKAELSAQRETNEHSEHDSKLARELERQTLKVSQLERQLTSAKQKLKSTEIQGTNTSKSSTTHEISDLESEVMQWKAKYTKAEAETREQKQQASKHYADLQKLMAKQRDYSEMKAELDRLKSNEAGLADKFLTAAAENSGDALLRRRLQEAEQALENKGILFEKQKAEIENSKAVIQQLEDEIHGLQQNSADTFSTISGWTAVPRNSSGPGTLGGSSERSAVSGIIGQQRDRYKKRVQELEEAQHERSAELATVQKELLNVSKERHTLYERVRQLQALIPNQASTGISPSPTLRNTGDTSFYEPSNDAKLKELELDRRIQGLSTAHAKVVEFFARGLVDEKLRVGVTAYAAFLHILAVYGILF